ncbi:MAG: threonine--tRNA ligase [Patescibacteria group bacterium]|nr:threonine--tRNA ligase [Patescibacteria group bacterium]
MSNSSSNQVDKLHRLRHTAEHVLTSAMHNLYGRDKVVMAMGPATDDGFYFDFDSSEDFKLTEKMLPAIEAEMQRIIDKNLVLKQVEIAIGVARQVFADNLYKQEWLGAIEATKEPATVYLMGREIEVAADEKYLTETEANEIKRNDIKSFIDLCKGPHVKSTGEIKAFKLLNIAGAYWHGDEKNKMLTRIYGTAFSNPKDLEQYLWRLKEAEKRDHRKIAKKMKLFLFDEEFGQGLPLYKPNGAIIRKEIMDFAFDTYMDRGYKPVSTPHIANLDLWKRSGHWHFYRESMYSPMKIDDEQYMLKPMNCPGHVKIYNSDLHSYRDLPVRLAEMGTVYRYEKSGELNGILRPRAFTQDDAHIICTPDQLEAELVEMIDLTEFIYSKFGFTDPKISLSVRDKADKDKHMGEDKMWKLAEEILEKVLKAEGMDYERIKGEAAFYGPKVDFMYEDALGREQQLTTIQIDFNLPEKFDMTYVDENGERQQPFMLHRALLGSLERFMGVLIEHTAGNFPAWLSPLQVVILPITDRNIDYANEVKDKLHQNRVRVEVDERSERLSAKIRDAEVQRVPFMLVVGDREQENGEVTVRMRDQEKQEKQEKLKVDDFVKMVNQKIRDKE